MENQHNVVTWCLWYWGQVDAITNKVTQIVSLYKGRKTATRESGFIWNVLKLGANSFITVGALTGITRYRQHGWITDACVRARVFGYQMNITKAISDQSIFPLREASQSRSSDVRRITKWRLDLLYPRVHHVQSFPSSDRVHVPPKKSLEQSDQTCRCHLSSVWVGLQGSKNTSNCKY